MSTPSVPNGLGRELALDYATGMARLGSRIEETGLLLREGDTYLLRRDLGGRFRLDMRRVGPPAAGRRMQVTGVLVEDDLIDVSAIAPEQD